MTARRPAPPFSSARGFTLVELMVVVVIITILAAIAVPGISRQLANREARQSADMVGLLYRNARMRAASRGSAVLVRYTAGGAYEMREAVLGTTNPAGDNACSLLPRSSCAATNWAATASSVYDATTGANQLLETFDASGNGQMVVTMDTPAATAVTSLDICFTPLGRTFYGATGSTLAPMTGAPRARIALATGGVNRQVVIPPSGVARVSTLEGP